MAKVIHGTWNENDKYAWEGEDTSYMIKWKASANSYEELFYELCDMGVITNYHGDDSTLEAYYLDKVKKSYEDYKEYDEIDFDRINEEAHDFMTESDYKDLILSSDGNAYYQKFYEYDEEKKEFV